MKNAYEIIEPAESYYLLSKDHPTTGSKPVRVGTRIELEFCLQDIDADMVIATSGDNKGKRCVILVDFTDEEILKIVSKSAKVIMSIKEKN